MFFARTGETEVGVHALCVCNGEETRRGGGLIVFKERVRDGSVINGRPIEAGGGRKACLHHPIRYSLGCDVMSSVALFWLLPRYLRFWCVTHDITLWFFLSALLFCFYAAGRTCIFAAVFGRAFFFRWVGVQEGGRASDQQGE